MPALSSQAKEPQSIVGRIQGSGLDGQAKGFAGVVEGGEAVDAVVAAAIGQGDDERQLAAMVQAVSREFVEAVTIDPALTVAVPAPEGVGVVVGS
jgi:hypothetical protein